MGIRIHKMLGYGLTDVVPDDPRINWQSPLFEYELEGEETVVEYLDFSSKQEGNVEKHIVRWDKAEDAKRRRYSVQDCFQWGTVDGGLENVLCIRPLAWLDWYRYDNIMDWVEQSYGPEEQHDDVKVLPDGIFPHMGIYMDARTGEKLGAALGRDVQTWLMIRNYAGNHKGASVEDLSETLDNAAQIAGFKDHAEAEKFCVPFVPEEVQSLVGYTKLFTNNKVWKDLRPMVYTWWA